MRLRNAGAVVTQTALAAATVAGQGAAQTVDTVYSVGQSNSTRYISVDSSAGFAVGQYVTIHDGTLGRPSWKRTARRRLAVISIDTGKLVLDKPLLKPHAVDDFVTNALDVHASVFMGGLASCTASPNGRTPSCPQVRRPDDRQPVRLARLHEVPNVSPRVSRVVYSAVRPTSCRCI